MSGLFSPISSTNKPDRHDITEKLLKVALHTITQTLGIVYHQCLNFLAMNCHDEPKQCPSLQSYHLVLCLTFVWNKGSLIMFDFGLVFSVLCTLYYVPYIMYPILLIFDSLTFIGQFFWIVHFDCPFGIY